MSDATLRRAIAERLEEAERERVAYVEYFRLKALEFDLHARANHAAANAVQVDPSRTAEERQSAADARRAQAAEMEALAKSYRGMAAAEEQP